jgi:hypothetical protein
MKTIILNQTPARAHAATWLLILTAAVVMSGTVKALDLVKNGTPVATIITSVPLEEFQPAPAKGKGGAKRNAPPNEEATSVRVLVDWVKKITDAELPIANAPIAGSASIYIGKAALEAGLKLDDISSPSREGVRITVDAKRVLIAGQKDAATLKAVCRFLEELGCRYFMDGPLGEVYPRTKTLSVAALKIVEKPGLLERNPKGPSWPGVLWKAWNGGGGESFGHSHSWGSYVSPDVFAEHPEYFAMGADGERKAGGWLCTSNPGLRNYFAERVIAAIEKGNTHPSLSPTDGRGYCQCPTCKAQDDPSSFEPSSGTVSVTNRYVDFFDAVARQVAKVHPESVLSFYCYADYTQPPTVKRKLSPNLCAMIAPIRYCRLHGVGHENCPSRIQQLSMTEGWAAVASKIGYYNYMYNLADATLPFFKFSACKKEFPYLMSKGLSYMTIEVLSDWHIYGPQTYLSLKLAYDPTASPEAIMEDYWLKFYGPKAAPFMKDYWMGIDAAQNKVTTHAGCFFGLAQIYTPEFMKECEGHLKKAAAAAKGDGIHEQRVKLHADGFKSAVEYRKISDDMNRGDFATALSDYEAMTARLNEMAANGLINREYATAYLKRFLSNTIVRGAAATAPPNRLVQVLPDRWQFTFDETDEGNEKQYHTAAFDDSKWASVATHNITLDAQGFDKNTIHWFRTKFTAPATKGKLMLFFGEVDGAAEVYVNGKKIDVVPYASESKAKKPDAKPAAPPTLAPGIKAPREGLAKARAPFEVDISGAVKPGENVIALRADHSKISELALGGILRPVLLIEKP